MKKQFCSNCKKITQHNVTTAKYPSGYRCTNCGVPVSNHNMNDGMKAAKIQFAARKAAGTI